jgi:hypothetical protein
MDSASHQDKPVGKRIDQPSSYKGLWRKKFPKGSVNLQETSRQSTN